MKKAVMAIVLSVSAVSSWAETGIGISFESDEAKIYLPFDVSEQFRLEPSLSYSKVDRDDYFDSENIDFGLGMFYQREQTESLNLLLGARVGYFQSELVTYEINQNLTSDGYYVAPTLGFEYFIAPNFSLGGEAAFRYQSGSVDLPGEPAGRDTTGKRTDTNLIARFYF